MMRYIICCLCLFTLMDLYGQTATIYGQVLDAKSKDPLIGVNILVEELGTGSVTDIDGKFQLTLEPGSYNITASYIGYATVTRSNVLVKSKGNSDLNFEMQESSLSLETVEVTANPFQTSLVTPLSQQRLSPEEIQTYPGGNNDIAKVVQSLPGVSGSIGGFRNDVIIRGGAPNENVYYLDGIEIPNINHFATQGSAGGPVGLLNVDFIEGVELSSSAFGAKYDNPLSGVLQFDQRAGNKRERQTNFRISASEAALTTEGPIGKRDNAEANTSYIVSVRRSYLQFLFQLLQLPIRPDYWDYQYKIDHTIDDRNTIFLTGIGSIDDFTVEAPEEFDAEQQSVLEQVPIIEQRTNTIGLGWRHKLKENKGILNLTLSNNSLKNDFRRYEDNENQEGLILQNISKESEQKLRTEYTRFNKGWTLSTGFNLINAHYETETEYIALNNAFNTDINFVRYGLFGQITKSFLNDRLSTSAGIRMDDHTFDENFTLFHTFSPRASLSWVIDANNRWRFNASVGKYYKIAPYTVLGYQENNEFFNKNVDYIGSVHTVAGLEYRLGEFGKISVEGFLKKYTNYPISLIDGVSLANKGGDFSVLGNEAVLDEGEGRTYGLELLYQKKLSNNFYGILAYTWFRSEFTDINGTYLPSFWDSKHLISFTGGYQFGKNWEISLRYRFAGKTPFAPVDLESTQNTYPILVLDYDGLRNNRLDAFNQLDLRLDKKWNFPSFAFNLFLEIQNALGTNTPSPPDYGLARDDAGNVLEPRQIKLIEATASSALPSFGLAIDF